MHWYEASDLPEDRLHLRQEDAASRLPSIVPCAKDGNCLYEPLGNISGLYAHAVRLEICNFLPIRLTLN